MRRAITIIAIVIVLGGLGAALYFYFTSQKAGVTISPTTTLPQSGNGTIPVEQVPTDTPVTPTPGRFTQVSKGPVVPGPVVIDIPAANASSTADVGVQFIERQSGNVYRYLTRAGTLTRTSNRTVPGIQSSMWVPSGATAFVRYLSSPEFSTINTYALSSTGAQGVFLAQNLADVSVASTTVLTLTSGVNGSVGSIVRPDGSNARQVFTTPLSQIRAYLAGSQYVVASKPSWGTDGMAYLVSSGGVFSRIAGPHKGLVALPSPSGRFVLISYVAGEAMQMKLVNTATFEVTPLPIATIADKCVWTARDEAIFCGVPMNPPPARYPDDWYQGSVPLSDRIWKIDVTGRFAQLVLDLTTEEGAPFDVVAPAINRGVTVLSFVNKNDGSLWKYSL